MSTPTFTSDWFLDKVAPWRTHVVPRLRNRSAPAKWLDLGSYEGRSALWALDHVLPPGSTVTCVDLFDSNFHGLEGWGKRGYEERFDANTSDNPGIVKRKGWSHDVLASLQHERFHGAYVDGDHLEHVLYHDLELLWPLLLPQAVVVCDDYGCSAQPGARAAIEKFLSQPDVRCRVLHAGFQLIFEKSPDPVFSRDFFGLPKQLAWVEHIVPRTSMLDHPLSWLEVGVYEGQSALWTLENILTDISTLTSSQRLITCVDVFDRDQRELVRWGGNLDYELSFDANVGHRHGVRKIKTSGKLAMQAMLDEGCRRFDGIYVDSDHAEDVVRAESRLAWNLLLPGGILVLDDYGSPTDPGVRPAARSLLDDPSTKHQVLHEGFQLVVLKTE
jgi:predicted O-methyltransferase YrrM